MEPRVWQNSFVDQKSLGTSSVLNVAYFSNQFASAEGHGIARYAHEMYKGLRKCDNLAIRPVAAWSSLPPERLSAMQADTGLELINLGRKLTPLTWHFLDVPTLERLIGGTVDVVHAVSLGYAISTRKPYVVTVHDLGPLTHPEYFSNNKPWIMERSLRQAEARADAIVCVSDSTANEVEGYLGAHVVDRIHVIKEGVSPEFFTPGDMACLAGLNLPSDDVPIILTAGKMSPRKNMQGVIRALKQVRNRIDHHLVLVGAAGWETEIVLRELDDGTLLNRVHLLGYVTDDQLRALYRRASLYIHPSLYEGFGLTVLEAMASGVPVITSNVSSLPEVAGEAGMLVDPTSDAEIAHAIYSICSDSTLREAKITQGLERAGLFSWDDCARKLRNVFASLGR
jgi:glycosyltransferase involved in cell wall biosynthesis